MRGSMSKSLIGFLVLVVGGGLLLGLLFTPGPWYAQLAKPPFNPPNWLFGPVWSILYVMVAVAGWRLWRRKPHGGAMRAWWLQLVLNFLWTPVFFGFNSAGLALLVILLLLGTIVMVMVLARPVDTAATWLFAPYLAWVAFASLLNASIWWLN